MKSLFSGHRRQSGSSALQSPPKTSTTSTTTDPTPPPQPPSRPPKLPNLSDFSTPAVRNSAWSSLDFMLGAGMVVIQPITKRIVVVYETEKKYWFLPRGRKDVGESLEQTALREAHEETGYRASFLPLFNPTHQPLPSGKKFDKSEWRNLNTEPVYTTITSWHPRRRHGKLEPYGGEYLTVWYAGQIPDEAIPEKGTGMADEQNYQSHLLSIDEAMECLVDTERLVLDFTWRLFIATENELKKSRDSIDALGNN